MAGYNNDFAEEKKHLIKEDKDPPSNISFSSKISSKFVSPLLV